MEQPPVEHLPTEQRIALAFTRPDLRAALAVYFVLDRRLSQIVAHSNEPMLGQMRLSWWREQLGKAVAERPIGDEALDAAGRHWSGDEEALLALVDGWEELLVSDRIARVEAERFCTARARPLAQLARRLGSISSDRALAAGTRWAAADAAARVTDERERQALLDTGIVSAAAQGGIGRAMRGLAVLEVLALRSLRRGGRPLMEGRGAALIAMRVGLLGR